MALYTNFVLSLTLLTVTVLAEDFYSFSTVGIQGNELPLEKYRGKITLIVNVASECGFTDRHYRGLVRLQNIFAETGSFNVLGYPCNQFGGQEPGDAETIKKFVKGYSVDFTIMRKINVLGNDVPAEWKFLIKESGQAPNWNFWKYLVGPDGHFIKAWGPWSDVEEITPEIKHIVEEVLNAQGPKRPTGTMNTKSQGDDAYMESGSPGQENMSDRPAKVERPGLRHVGPHSPKIPQRPGRPVRDDEEVEVESEPYKPEATATSRGLRHDDL